MASKELPVFTLEDILDDATCRELYVQFLSASSLLEPLLFIEQVEEFVILKSTNNRFIKAKSIVDSFLKNNARHELNLEHSTREQILEAFKQCSSERCDIQLFDNVNTIVLIDLKQNTISRFCKSKAFMDYYALKMGQCLASPHKRQSNEPNHLLGLQDLSVKRQLPQEKKSLQRVHVDHDVELPAPRRKASAPESLPSKKSAHNDILQLSSSVGKNLSSSTSADELTNFDDDLIKAVSGVFDDSGFETSQLMSFSGSIESATSPFDDEYEKNKVALKNQGKNFADEIAKAMNEHHDKKSVSKTWNAIMSRGQEIIKKSLSKEELWLLDNFSEQDIDEFFNHAFSKFSPKSIRLQSKRFLFKKHKNLFEAIELTNWFEKHVSCDKKAAQTLATVFLQRNYIQDYHNQKLSTTFLANEKYFYRVTRRPRVVIIGGGYSGVIVANQLKSNFDVCLIDKRPNFEYIMDYPLLTVNPSEYKKLTYPYSKLGSLHFIQNHVKHITPTHVVLANVHYSDKENSCATVETINVPFDYLVVATGSRCSISFDVCEKSMQNVVFSYSSKSILSNFSKCINAKNMVVIGAGPTGIEVAGELANTYKTAKITLLSREAQFLQKTGNSQLHKYIVKHYSSSKNLECLFSRHVTSIKDSTVYMMNKECATQQRFNSVSSAQPMMIEGIKADVIFICCGIRPRSELFEKHMYESLDANKYVRVNNYLQVFKKSEVFSEEEEDHLVAQPVNLSVEDLNSLKNASDAAVVESNSSPSIMLESPSGQISPLSNNKIKHSMSAPITIKEQLMQRSSTASSLSLAVNLDEEKVYYPNIFAVGDIVNLQEEQLAQIAMLHAVVCAKNIKRVHKGKSLHKYEPKSRIKIISTGCGKAIMYQGNTVIQEGKISSAIKQFLRSRTFVQINK